MSDPVVIANMHARWKHDDEIARAQEMGFLRAMVAFYEQRVAAIDGRRRELVDLIETIRKEDAQQPAILTEDPCI